MGHERLRRPQDVRDALRRGRRDVRPGVVVHLRHRGDGGPPRVTTVASRRVGGAVVRNRAKRVLRAAVAPMELPPGVDVALVARESTPTLRAPAVEGHIRAAVEQMFDERAAGLPSDGTRP